MLERRASCREIARELGRSPSTVSAEVASHRFVTAPKARRGERVDATADLSAACPRLAAWPRCCNGCGRYRAIGCKRRPHVFYEARAAQLCADSVLVSSRRGIGLATLMWTVPGGAQETGGPYMRDPRHPRHFTDEFKRQIVDLYNAGKPKREIMDEYDLGKSTVERWIKSINATGSPRAADNRTPEQNRILELERENRRLRMEVDVLKQAALIYARK